MLWRSSTEAISNLLPGLQAVAPRILIPGFEHLLDAPDKVIDVVAEQPRGRPLLLLTNAGEYG
jgi:hypothetical protein